MDDALSIWEQLKTEHPDRTARVASHVEPVSGAAQEFVDRILDLRQSAAIGNEKCGTVGNPYEQPAEDMSVLLAAAERLSGLAARSRWERSNNSFKGMPLRGTP